MQEFGLLGLLPDPELHDSRSMLRAGDGLITFTGGVTEARSYIGRDLHGDDRLRGLIAGLGDMSAARMAEAIQQATLSVSGGKISDNTVALVLMVPWRETSGQPGCSAPGTRRGHAAPGGRRHDPGAGTATATPQMAAVGQGGGDRAASRQAPSGRGQGTTSSQADETAAWRWGPLA